MTRAPFVAVAAPLVLAGCSGPTEAEPWAKAFGDAAEQTQIHIAAGPSGEIAITGAFSGGVDFGGKPFADPIDADNDVFVASLDASGAHRWSGAAGGPGLQASMGAAFDVKGNAIFAGSFEQQVDFGAGPIEAVHQDIWVTSFEPSGRLAWMKHFSADDGGPSGAGDAVPAAGVAVGGDGNLVIAGFFTGTLGFGGPPLDTLPEGEAAFVAKLDPAGGHVWSRAFGGAGHDAYGVAADAQGNVAVAGTNRGVITLGDTTADAGTSGGGRAFVAGLDAAGEPAFLVQMEGDGSSMANALALDADGSVLLGGCFAAGVVLGSFTADAGDGANGFVAKISPTGTPLWLSTLPGACVYALAVDASGHVHAGGEYRGAPDLGGGPLPLRTTAAYVVELDADGAFVRADALGTKDQDSTVTSLAAVDGGIVAAGAFQGMLHVGATTLVSRGGSDLFVARLR